MLSNTFAQDIILLNDGRKVDAKILETNQMRNIKFKSLQNLAGPHTPLKRQLLKLKKSILKWRI